MKGLHDEIGHWSFATTHKIISDRFRGPKMRIDVAHLVRSFISCQKANPSEKNGPNGRVQVSGMCHTWSIDFLGPLKEPAACNEYILLAVENFSNWPVAVLLVQIISTVAG